MTSHEVGRSPYDAAMEIPGLRLGDPIGAGASGTVHEAVVTGPGPGDLAVGSTVAVKIVHAPSARLDEAELASRLEHDGVVRVHATGHDGDLAWIVMDRLSGPDLGTRLGDGPLAPDEAVALVGAVADAVASVHAAGIVHRDLKPANIVLDDGRPVVVDLGVALSADPDDATGGSAWARTAPTATTGVGAAVGTFAWMAPEQWRGEPVSPATDVYALGGVLHAALTGQPPYAATTLPGLAYDVALSPAPRPSDLGAPPRLDDVVATAMAKDPADRYTDAAAFSRALSAASSGDRRPGPRWPASTRRRWVRRGAVAVGVLAVAAVSMVVGLELRGEPEAGEGPRPGQVLTVCAERDATMRAAPRSSDVVERIDHGTRVRVVADDRNSPTWALVRAPDGREGFVLLEFVHATCR